jgi:hypothetical protein
MSKLNTNPADIVKPFCIANIFCEGVVRRSSLARAPASPSPSRTRFTATARRRPSSPC